MRTVECALRRNDRDDPGDHEDQGNGESQERQTHNRKLPVFRLCLEATALLTRMSSCSAGLSSCRLLCRRG